MKFAHPKPWPREWTRMFAWLPVHTGSCIAWLEFVEYRYVKEDEYFDGAGMLWYSVFEYRSLR